MIKECCQSSACEKANGVLAIVNEEEADEEDDHYGYQDVRLHTS